jgi:hypothetical protein
MENSVYDIDALNRLLSPPPRIQPFVENWPVIEPPFRGQSPPYEQDAEEWDAVESSPVPDGELMVLTDEALARIREVALGHEDVQRLLADRRYIAIGGTLRDSKEPGSRPSVLFILYDYTANETIEVMLERDSLEVIDVATARYQPAPLEEEIGRAIDLARQHEKMADRLTDGLVGTAILVTFDDPRDPRYNHRLFDIRFGCPDERLPRYLALVDLSTEEVISTGRVDGVCGGDDHE